MRATKASNHVIKIQGDRPQQGIDYNDFTNCEQRYSKLHRNSCSQYARAG